MSYWIASIGLIAFGVVGMLSIGRPFLLVGLAMRALGRLRSRPALFWPPFAAVIAWNGGFLAIAPSYCTATQAIGGDLSVSGDATTVCSSLIGVTYSGSGIYNPSIEPAHRAGVLLAAVTFVVVLAVMLWLRRAGRVDAEREPCSLDRSHPPGARSEVTGSRQAAIAAAGIGAAVDAGYILLVHSQGSVLAPRVVFVAAWIAVLSALSLAGVVVSPRDRFVARAFLYAAAMGYLVAGTLTLASIGIFLILAGLLAFAAAGPRRLSAGVVAAVAVAPTAVFVVGIVLT